MKYQWTVLTVTTVGVLMSGIDSRIIVIGLPQVASALGADVEQAIWFTQAYVVGSTIILLISGGLGDMLGRVKVYNIGFAVFTIGSALASLSPNPSSLIVFRILQGLGAGIIFTSSAAVITDATPPNGLGLALGINQLGFRFGGMAGLTLSGLILTYLDWRALFYINVPIGIFGTIWAHRRLKELAVIRSGVKLDLPGFVSFTLFVVFALLTLTYAAYGIAAEGTVYAFAALTVITLAFFVMHERGTQQSVINLSLLRIKQFTGGILAQLLNAAAWGAVLILLSLYLQLALDLTPLQAGIAIIPFEIAFLVTGPISGRLSDMFGHMPFTTAGLITTSLAIYLLSSIGTSGNYVHTALSIILFGIGSGLFASPNIRSVMIAVPAESRGVASAFRAVCWNVGYALSWGLAVLFMTFTAPYPIITSIVSATNPATIPLAYRNLFVDALKNAYLGLAVINAVALVPNLLRK